MCASARMQVCMWPIVWRWSTLSFHPGGRWSQSCSSWAGFLSSVMCWTNRLLQRWQTVLFLVRPNCLTLCGVRSFKDACVTSPGTSSSHVRGGQVSRRECLGKGVRCVASPRSAEVGGPGLACYASRRLDFIE